MKKISYLRIAKESFQVWRDARAATMGAALAYYTVFSLVPLLMIALAVAGLVFGPKAASGQVVEEIQGTVGVPVAAAIQDMLQQTSQRDSSIIATILGFAVLVFGASGVFSELQSSLNTIWHVEPRPGAGILAFVRDRSLSFAMVAVTCFILLASLVVSAVLAALAKTWSPSFLPGGIFLWQALNLIISFGIITLLFALIYKVLPDADINWRNVWFGAAVTALLFSVGKFLLGLYLGWSGAVSAYGAAGSIALILLWVYYSAQVFLFGAAFTHVHARFCDGWSELGER